MIDPFHQQMIQKILHIPHPEAPSIGAEQLAHGPALLLRLQMPAGRPQLPERIMEKFSVAVRHRVALLHRRPVEDLPADAVNARHMLSGHGPEIMGRPHAQPAVDPVVLHHMSDIFHAVVLAPGPDGIAEILLVQL